MPDTGVTVRTLHIYDRLGLLRPAALTSSGYRLYGEAELERHEQILALRFVGFNLEQALRMQRERDESADRWEAPQTVIEVFKSAKRLGLDEKFLLRGSARENR